jgi:rhodanese-related sulfurtransferase
LSGRYTSSLAAAALQDIEFLNVTDVVGGFQAWNDEGIPVELESQWVYRVRDAVEPLP